MSAGCISATPLGIRPHTRNSPEHAHRWPARKTRRLASRGLAVAVRQSGDGRSPLCTAAKPLPVRCASKGQQGRRPPTLVDGNSPPPCVASSPCGVYNVARCPFSVGEERERWTTKPKFLAPPPPPQAFPELRKAGWQH